MKIDSSDSPHACLIIGLSSRMWRIFDAVFPSEFRMSVPCAINLACVYIRAGGPCVGAVNLVILVVDLACAGLVPA